MSAGALAGEAACLAAALCWAVAVMLFRGPIAEHGARAVNLAKNSLAAVLLGITVLLFGQVPELLATPPDVLVVIAASALLGLSVGDTALFAAVRRLGAHRALLLMTLVPLFAALMARVFQHERLLPSQMLGGAIVLLGVAAVVAPDRRDRAGVEGLEDTKGARGLDLAGLGLGVLGAAGQAAGLVLAKSALATMPILGASFVRMTIGAAGLALMLAAGRRLEKSWHALRRRRALVAIVPPALLGTYVAFLLMMAGVAWAPAAVAAVLLGTSPVFSLFLEARAQGRRVSARHFFGTALAVAGVAVLVAAG